MRASIPADQAHRRDGLSLQSDPEDKPMETILEVDGKDARESPSAADIAAAVDGPRGEDFFITLHRGDDDYMDVTLDEGELWVEAEDGGKILEARSHVDTEAAKAMLTAFAEGRADRKSVVE